MSLKTVRRIVAIAIVLALSSCSTPGSHAATPTPSSTPDGLTLPSGIMTSVTWCDETDHGYRLWWVEGGGHAALAVIADPKCVSAAPHKSSGN